MTIVGLCGLKRSGKDTVGRMLIEIGWSYRPVVRLAFADALKLEVSQATGVSVNDIEANKAVFRELLQVWGTEFRRRWNGDDYWIAKLRQELNRVPDNALVVITDARFPNEIEFVRSRGGVMVEVVRPGTEVSDAHASENAWRGVTPDFAVVNDSTLAELRERVSILWGLINPKRSIEGLTPVQQEFEPLLPDRPTIMGSHTETQNA